MAGNRTEFNIVADVGVQNGLVPQVDVAAADDVQNVIVPQADSPLACGIQNVIVPQVDFVVAAIQYGVVPQVDVDGVPKDVVPQVDAPTTGGIQNSDVPQVDVIAACDQNGIVSQVDQNDTVQQVAADVEPTESSDDDEMYEAEDERRGKKRRYQRHTQEQYRELENFFLEHPHPNEKQRIELSMKLGMEIKQIKFWFQNHRKQMKTQLERHENILLRNQNDELIAENAVLRQNVTEPRCTSCGGLVVPTPLAFENEQLRAQNARLKEEVGRLYALANRYNRPLISPSATTLAPTSPTLDENNNNNRNPVGPNLGRNKNRNDNNTKTTTPSNKNPASLCIGAPTKTRRPVVLSNSGYNWEVYKQYVHRATTEVMSMTYMGEPLWVKKSDGEEALNLKYYPRVSAHGLVESEVEFVTEATRASDIVCINGLALVGIMMNVDRWMEAFAGLVASGTKLDMLSSSELLMINAEFQPISPLIPVRTTKFIRSCKKEMESVWSVIDICVDANEGSSSNSDPTSLRLPSGCIIYDLNNGYSKVTWVEHVQYDESLVHPMMRPMVRSGKGFGARRWIATLQRYCECVALLLASSSMPQDPSMLSMDGKNSLMKLSQKMVNSFYRGISIGLSNSIWEKLSPMSVGEDVTIMSRKNSTDPEEAVGIVLSASTSLWLPVSRRRVFEFLMREDTRKDWDFLINGGSLEEVVRIPKAQNLGNSVSILRVAQNSYSDYNGTSFILQETWNDATTSLLVYAAVDAPILDLAMSGGDNSFVALMPSGFTIFPGGKGGGGRGDGASTSTGIGGGGEEGCITTAEFQILASTDPDSMVTIDLVSTLTILLSCTIQRIKDAFQIP
ncbi:Homeobox-leucine zipper protein HDG1 [Linum perenne]